LFAAALVAASGIQRSFAFAGSINAVAIAAPAFDVAGRSASASSDISRTCGSGSLIRSAARTASTEAAFRGNTCTALRRTPAERCFNAAYATFVACGCEPLSTPSPCSVHSACVTPAFKPISSEDKSAASFSSAGTTSVFPRSTSSRCACFRQNIFSCFNVATSLSGVASFNVKRRPLAGFARA
jgi:hypothetical protein